MAMTAFAIRSRAVLRPAEARHWERDLLADHLPFLRGRSRHEFDADVPLRNVARPRGPAAHAGLDRGRVDRYGLGTFVKTSML